MVEHRTENPGVGGSTPPRTTFFLFPSFFPFVNFLILSWHSILTRVQKTQMNTPKKYILIIFITLLVTLGITIITTDWKIIMLLTAIVPILVVFQTLGILKYPGKEKNKEDNYNDWYEKK